MKKTIKVSCTIDNDDWSDEEFDDNSPTNILITEDMIQEIINSRGLIPKNCYIESIDFVELIRY